MEFVLLGLILAYGAYIVVNIKCPPSNEYYQEQEKDVK